MKGMELSRLYYESHCSFMLRRRFPELVERIAVGLVGEGSECWNFDDEISQDHDWGAAICLWLTEEDYKVYGSELQKTIDTLARQAKHAIPIREESPMAEGRSGVMETGGFYFRHIGFNDGPQTELDWMRIPEERLATVTNGEIFADPLGKFSGVRQRLLAFYPEDVRRKKLAARLSVMAQTGQYNLARCFRRGERVAAHLAESLFVSNTLSAAFLLNRRYKPFYKWAHRALRQLPLLGFPLADRMEELITAEQTGKIALVENISRTVADEIRRQGLSEVTDDFLLEQAIAVQNGIEDRQLRSMSVFVG